MRKINKIELKCKFCGKTFYKWKSEIINGRGIHCSDDCKHKDKIRFIKICKFCSKEFHVYQCRKDNAKFCSKDCHTKSECFTRKNSKNTVEHRLKISNKALERVKKGKNEDI